MTDEEREEAEERAAIMQYHGNATREQAEFWAVDHIMRQREQRWTPVREEIKTMKQYAIDFAR